MRYIADDFIYEAKKQSIKLTEIANEQALDIRYKIEEKYCKKGDASLWERIKTDSSGFYSPSNKGIFNKIDTVNDGIFVFFEKNTDSTIFKLNCIKDLINIVNELFGFVFYITDSDESFLLCWNDHEFIIGAGKANKWVDKLNLANKSNS